MRDKPKYNLESKCKFCGQQLQQRRGIPKPHKKWYYLVVYYCSVCRLSFTNDSDKSFQANPKPDIFRKVKADTGINREIRKIFMDFIRSLTKVQKIEVKRELPSFMEMWKCKK